MARREDEYDDEYEEDFDDEFDDDEYDDDELFGEGGDISTFQMWVRSSPWFAISALIHLILAAYVLYAMATEWQPPDEDTVIQASQPVKPPQEIEEPPPDEVITDKLIKDDVKVEEPVISDSTDDTNETDNNEEFEEAKGDDSMSDSDLTSDSNLDAIGIGGGSGGAFGGRRGGKKDRVKGGGGSPATETAVFDALLWLKRHQSADGSWDVDGFHNNCESELGPQCDGIGTTKDGDPGVTGLALLAYLGAGYTHNDDSVFADTIKNALQYLKDLQDDDGYFAFERTSHFYMYGHSIATLAMTEAYGLTEQDIFKGSAQRGVEVILKAQNESPTTEGELWGWRYSPNDGDADSSVTGWMVMALKSAKAVDLFYDEDNAAYTAKYKEKFKKSFKGARNWFDFVTEDAYYRAGYMETGTSSALPEESLDDFRPVEVCTSIAMLSRIFLGDKPTTAYIRGGASLLNQDLPTWGDKKAINYYYWYYGTLAMFQVGGDYWKNWNGAMKEAVVDNQLKRDGGCGWGSWDPKVAAWGGRGGRVYATAINCLTLEVYYRYDKVFK